MATPNQKAAARPISFVLHNTATGAPPIVVPLVIRPEDLTRSEASRLSVTQTLGGAWADNFGPAVPTVQIAGHTGWGAGGRQNGLTAFQNLHDRVFTGWHTARAQAAASGLDPDKVRLIFSDGLDGFTWLVAPSSFILKRNKSRPLLAQYQISLIWLDDVMSDPTGLLGGLLDGVFGNFFGGFSGIFSKERSLKSLLGSIGSIRDLIDNGIGNPLGSLGDVLGGFSDLAENALTKAADAVGLGSVVSGSAAGSIVSLASDLARGGANAASMIQTADTGLSQRQQADFQQLGSAFLSAATLLDINLKPGRVIQDTSALFSDPLAGLGAVNPFPSILPAGQRGAAMTPAAWSSLLTLKTADPVLAPLGKDALALNMATIAGGTFLNG